MKELRISLSDETVEALEAGVAAGEAASISELIEAALGLYLDPGLPALDAMFKDALEAEAEAEATGGWRTPEEVMENVLKSLRE
jgi:Arc/MetJ-type ribon-helix-helix transcriptional regulator